MSGKYSDLDWIIPRGGSRGKKRRGGRPRERDPKVSRGITQLRNWHLGITEEDEYEEVDEREHLDSPHWASRSSSDFYSDEEEDYPGMSKQDPYSVEPIGLGGNELYFDVKKFPEKPRHLRQDGKVREKDDNVDEFYGPRWRKTYLERVDAIQKDPDYIWLKKLAGATNTTVDNLYTVKDLETRAIRSRAIAERQSADIRARFERIIAIRSDVQEQVSKLEDERAKLETTSVGRDVANQASWSKKGLRAALNTYEKASFDGKRLEDYEMINRVFTKWVINDTTDPWTPEMLKSEGFGDAMDRRLKSIQIVNDLNSSPGTASVMSIRDTGADLVKVVREQATLLSNKRNVLGRDRTGDFVFLGMWILYELRNAVATDLDLGEEPRVFKEIEENVLGLLTRQKSVPTEKSGVFTVDTVSGDSKGIDFSADVIDMEIALLQRYMAAKFNKDVYQSIMESVLNLDGIITSKRDVVSDKIAAAVIQLSGETIEPMRFMNNLSSGRGSFDIVDFQEEIDMDKKVETVKRVIESLRGIVLDRRDDITVIQRRIAAQQRVVTEMRNELDVLLTTDIGGDEPDIPYRAEGSWALDPINTGRIQPAPIVLHGIDEAYQKIVDYAPRYAPGNPEDEDQIEKNINKLQRTPSTRTYFTAIVAREMGLARQAFNVRWLPDLKGDHMTVILYNLRMLRSKGARNIDASFRTTLATM